MPFRQPFLTVGERFVENISSCRIMLIMLLICWIRLFLLYETYRAGVFVPAQTKKVVKLLREMNKNCGMHFGSCLFFWNSISHWLERLAKLPLGVEVGIDFLLCVDAGQLLRWLSWCYLVGGGSNKRQWSRQCWRLICSWALSGFKNNLSERLLTQESLMDQMLWKYSQICGLP